MKYLIITLISIFCLLNQNGKKKIYLKPTNDQVTQTQLSDAAQVMIDRLILIDIEASYKIDEISQSIAISSKSDLRDTRVNSLITRPGHLEFLEGRHRSVFFKAADLHDPLFALIDTSSKLSTGSPRIQEEVVGTFVNSSLEKVLVEIERLNQSGLSKNATLHYAPGDEGEDAKLFLLKSPEKNDMVLREDINRVASENSVGDELVIGIELSEKGMEHFARMTRNNINKVIAIVLDNEVLMAPRVNEEITGGKISITGDFSEDQTKYYHAILQGPKLPCAFTLK